MKKIAIPAILAVTVLVAGSFAFMPVQKASTVHNTIIAALGGNIVAMTPAVVTPAAGATDTATWTVGAPFCVLGLYRTGGVDANANLDVGPFTIATNLSPAATTPLAVNDGAGAASIAAADLLGREAAGIVEPPICGTTTVTVASASTAGDAIDTNTIQVVVDTNGAVAASAAVLT